MLKKNIRDSLPENFGLFHKASDLFTTVIISLVILICNLKITIINDFTEIWPQLLTILKQSF